jgi:WD40 repeat protein
VCVCGGGSASPASGRLLLLSLTCFSIVMVTVTVTVMVMVMPCTAQYRYLKCDGVTRGPRGGRVSQVIRSLAMSPDGTALVLGSTDKTVFMVNLSSGTFESLTGHTGPVVAVAFSADGSYAVTAAGNVLMVWDAAEALRKLEPPPPPPPRRTLFEF